MFIKETICTTILTNQTTSPNYNVKRWKDVYSLNNFIYTCISRFCSVIKSTNICIIRFTIIM